MTSSDKQSELWTALSQQAEVSRPLELEAPTPDGSQKLLVLDRLAEHVLSGFLPLFIVGTVVSFLSAWGSGDTAPSSISTHYDGGLLLVTGIVSALFWSWFFVPWSGTHERSKMWRLLLLSLAVAFFNLCHMTVTDIAINHLAFSTDTNLLESAVVWQTYLQKGSSPGALLAIFGTTILSVCLIPLVRSRFPWSRPTDWSRTRKSLPLFLVLPLVGLALFIFQGLKTPGYDVWERSVPLSLEQANWPKDHVKEDDQVWKKRLREWEETDELGSENRRSQQERIVQETLRTLPETAKLYDSDRKRVSSLLAQLSDSNEITLTQAERARISYWRVFHIMVLRQRYQQWTCKEEFEGTLIPHLLDGSLKVSELEHWLLRVENLSVILIQDESDERDLVSKDYFRRKEQALEVYSTDYRRLNPVPLPAPGSSFKPSPYVLVTTFRLAQEKRAWMKLHRVLETKTSEEARNLVYLLDENDPSLRESYGTSQEFAADLRGRRYSTYLKPQIQGLKLLLELRLVKLKTGVYPKSLDKLLPSEALSFWDWKEQHGQWSLRCNVYPKSTHTWLLP